MLVLGLTGSIGMGKSTTGKLFVEAGVPLYDADAEVHKLYEGAAVGAIEAAFPGTTSNGRVDRQKLRERVVHDPAAMKQLEQIVHPMLGAGRQKFFAEAERAGVPVVVVDVPAYRLWAFDGRDPAGELLEMRVIVGAAARTPTPLFIGQMRYLEFNPYWNVPRSIETAEIIPKLARDGGNRPASGARPGRLTLSSLINSPPKSRVPGLCRDRIMQRASV